MPVSPSKYDKRRRQKRWSKTSVLFLALAALALAVAGYFAWGAKKELEEWRALLHMTEQQAAAKLKEDTTLRELDGYLRNSLAQLVAKGSDEGKLFASEERKMPRHAWTRTGVALAGRIATFGAAATLTEAKARFDATREEERAAEADADGGPLERGERLLEVEVREEREQHDPVAEDRLRHRDRQDRQRRQPEERARHVDADAAHPRERGDVLREHVLRERERREAAHRLLLQALAHHRDLREEREDEPYD